MRNAAKVPGSPVGDGFRRTGQSPMRAALPLSPAERGIPKIVPDNYGQPKQDQISSRPQLKAAAKSPTRGGKKYGNIVQQFEDNAPGPLAHFEQNYSKQKGDDNESKKTIGVSGPFALTTEKLLVVGSAKERSRSRETAAVVEKRETVVAKQSTPEAEWPAPPPPETLNAAEWPAPPPPEMLDSIMAEEEKEKKASEKEKKERKEKEKENVKEIVKTESAKKESLKTEIQTATTTTTTALSSSSVATTPTEEVQPKRLFPLQRSVSLCEMSSSKPQQLQHQQQHQQVPGFSDAIKSLSDSRESFYNDMQQITRECKSL